LIPWADSNCGICIKTTWTELLLATKFNSVIIRNAYQLKRKKPMKPSTETLLDYLTAAAIGVGLACLLVAWWSS
jgi:hypothetical protein